jgi:hypothetical protein
MYSGCGGGYLIVVSNQPVPGAFKVTVRIAPAGSRFLGKEPKPDLLGKSHGSTESRPTGVESRHRRLAGK